MKKRIVALAVMAACVVVTVATLAGCGKANPFVGTKWYEASSVLKSIVFSDEDGKFQQYYTNVSDPTSRAAWKAAESTLEPNGTGWSYTYDKDTGYAVGALGMEYYEITTENGQQVLIYHDGLGTHTYYPTLDAAVDARFEEKGIVE